MIAGRNFIDDRSAHPLLRWIVMDELLGRSDLFEALEFRDAFDLAVARALGVPPEYDSWSRAPFLPGDVLAGLLDEFGPRLEEMWDYTGHNFITASGRPADEPDTKRDPFAQPSWWPIEQSDEDRVWQFRWKRVQGALNLLDDDERLDINSALLAFAEIQQCGSSQLGELRNGIWFRETVHLALPVLEKILADRGHLPDLWASDADT